MSHISIYLFDSDGSRRKVTVCIYDCIQVLDSVVKKGGRRFIVYKNQLIMARFTFKFYGVQDGDSLFVVRVKNKNLNFSNQIENTFENGCKNNEAQRRFLLSQNFPPNYNHSLVVELNRLVDQMFNKAEFKRIANQSFLQAFDLIYPKREKKTKEIPLRYCPSDHPCKDELPIFWPKPTTLNKLDS